MLAANVDADRFKLRADGIPVIDAQRTLARAGVLEPHDVVENPSVALIIRRAIGVDGGRDAVVSQEQAEM
jgi:hypothetical protein